MKNRFKISAGSVLLVFLTFALAIKMFPVGEHSGKSCRFFYIESSVNPVSSNDGRMVDEVEYKIHAPALSEHRLTNLFIRPASLPESLFSDQLHSSLSVDFGPSVYDTALREIYLNLLCLHRI